VAYAIGDIHGRLDLFDGLLGLILDDAAASRAKRLIVILLGDYIDRGPASASVLERISHLSTRGGLELHALKGNHEDALLQFLEDPAAGAGWVAHGGAETLASYRVAPPRLRSDSAGWSRTRDDLRAAMPAAHLALLTQLEVSFTLGDYFFVHAGVRPGVALDAQAERDLLWIRDEFLLSESKWSKVIVHGHTPVSAPVMAPLRLSLDTGAYATGVLSGVRLMDDQRTILQYSNSVERH
jgi:serine/threonine protein phosphatase 1